MHKGKIVVVSLIVTFVIAGGVLVLVNRSSNINQGSITNITKKTNPITQNKQDQTLSEECSQSSMPVTDADLNEVVGGKFKLQYSSPITVPGYKGFKCHYISDQHESHIVIYDDSDGNSWKKMTRILKQEDRITDLGDDAFRADPNYVLITKKGDKILEIYLGYITTPPTNHQPLLKKLAERALNRME